MRRYKNAHDMESVINVMLKNIHDTDSEDTYDMDSDEELTENHIQHGQ